MIKYVYDRCGKEIEKGRQMYDCAYNRQGN